MTGEGAIVQSDYYNEQTVFLNVVNSLRTITFFF